MQFFAVPQSEVPSEVKTEKESLHRPCSACREAKVRCNRENPCSRCRRLGLVCKPPPTVPRGRPSHHSRLLQLKAHAEAQTGEAQALAVVASTAGLWDAFHFDTYHATPSHRRKPDPRLDHADTVNAVTVVGCLALLCNAPLDDRLSLLFDMCDTGSTGSLNEASVRNLAHLMVLSAYHLGVMGAALPSEPDLQAVVTDLMTSIAELEALVQHPSATTTPRLSSAPGSPRSPRSPRSSRSPRSPRSSRAPRASASSTSRDCEDRACHGHGARSCTSKHTSDVWWYKKGTSGGGAGILQPLSEVQ